MVFKLAAAALLALCASTTLAVHPLKVQGTDFVDSVTNERFTIVGVAYQPGGSAGYKPDSGIDPLSNGTACLRDAILLQTLGVNTIRVYNLDPQINHDACAGTFNAAGIYMILDVNSPLPNESINAGEPWTSYDSVYLERIFAVVEAFKSYPNVLGFFAGNELVNDVNSGGLDPPYIRAVTRDLKNYIAKHSKRQIPVGYSAADVRPILLDTYSYTSCLLNGDSKDQSRADFFGLNSYSWCGASDFHASSYDQLVQFFSNATSPVFMSEFGCNKVLPRTFSEIGTIFSAPMTDVMSGGLAYQYTQDVSNFGLVQLNDNATATILPDFGALQSQLNNLDESALQSLNSTATALTPPTCTSSLIIASSFSSNFTIPDVPPGGQDLINNGLSNAPSGSLVSPTATDLPVPVYGPNGQPLQGLKLNVLANDASNVPGGKATVGNATSSSGSGSASGTAAAATPSATKGGAAILERAGTAAMALVGAAVVMVM